MGDERKQPRSNAANDAKQLAAKEWREQAISLRRQGFTIAEIAKRVQRSASNVHGALEEARKAVPVEDVEAIRKQQHDEIVRLKRAHRKMALAGDKDASDIYLKACAREAKLLGLDMPAKTELSGSIDVNETPSTEKARDIMRRMFGDVTPEAKPKSDEPKSDEPGSGPASP